MTLLQHHILALALTASTTLILGLLVLCADHKKSLNRVFAIYSASITCWSFAEAFLVNTPDKVVAWFWLTCEWLGVSFIAPSFLHTVFLFTQRYGKREKILVRAGYVLGALFILLHLTSNLVTMTVRPVAYTRYFAKLAPLGHYLPALFFTLVTIGLVTLWQSSRQVVGQHRLQTQILLWSSLIGYFGGGADWVLTLGYYVPVLNPFGIYGVSLYSIATFYAIYQHRLFEIRFVIRKSLIYSTLITSLTVGYFGLVYAAERLFQTTFGYQSLGVSLAAFALMALLFQPLRIGIQRVVDQIIFRAPQQTVAKKLEAYEARAREGERYRAIATLAAGIAHEIKNPLVAIQTFLEFFPKKQEDPEFRQQFYEILGSEVSRLQQVAQGLLELSKPQPLEFRPVDVRVVLDDVLALVRAELAAKAVEVSTTYTHNGSLVQGNAPQLKQALLNIILNAGDAMPHGGALTIFTGSVNGRVEVHIADTGQGIHPKDLPHLFEPFFSTKTQGTGLGLAIVRGIIEEHRGTISVQSTPGRGTTFLIRLPL